MCQAYNMIAEVLVKHPCTPSQNQLHPMKNRVCVIWLMTRAMCRSPWQISDQNTLLRLGINRPASLLSPLSTGRLNDNPASMKKIYISPHLHSYNMVGKSTTWPFFWPRFIHALALVAVALNTLIFLFRSAEYARSSFVTAQFNALSAFSRSVS